MNTIRSHILKHTVVSRQHLTPEIPLRLITPSCPLWSARAEESPFQDPFWAFYWPGGQATARYILDNTDIVRNRRVLDVGCGCGGVAIAASKMQAKYVLANDIDPYATAATQMNSEINESSVAVDNRDLIGSRCDEFDTVLIGDMFYNEEFADVLFKWLHRLAAEDKLVLIGDPGRHGLTDKRKNQMTLLAKYDLPKESCMENHGFTDTTLWKLNS